jgi:hypothetical protein
VVALLEGCGGHAGHLVEALEAGGAPGFQRKKTAELREYLEGEGYLDARPRRSADEIRTAALVAATGDIAGGRIAPADVDALLRRVATPAAAITAEPSASVSAGAFSLSSLPIEASVAPTGAPGRA